MVARSPIKLFSISTLRVYERATNPTKKEEASVVVLTLPNLSNIFLMFLVHTRLVRNLLLRRALNVWQTDYTVFRPKHEISTRLKNLA